MYIRNESLAEREERQMKKGLLAMVSILILCGGVASAEERSAAQETGLTRWLKDLQKKIELVVPRKSLPVSTGVAGVRGAKEDSRSDKLYWKGKKGAEPVTEEEMHEFQEAIQFAEKNARIEAMRELEEFMKRYPDSALVPDAKKTLDLLRVAEKEEKKP
jgi:hypothetical protein